MSEKVVNSETIRVTIVTPNGTIFDQGNINMAVLKTLSGQLGIMANHIPVVAALKIDEMHVDFSDEKKETFAINGGFAEFSNNLLTVVADSAEAATGIDAFRAQQAEKRAQDELKRAQTAEDRERAQVALARAVNRIQISKMK
jgi:F-type H+-transporting ATPase subunit epsilon